MANQKRKRHVYSAKSNHNGGKFVSFLTALSVCWFAYISPCPNLVFVAQFGIQILPNLYRLVCVGNQAKGIHDPKIRCNEHWTSNPRKNRTIKNILRGKRNTNSFNNKPLFGGTDRGGSGNPSSATNLKDCDVRQPHRHRLRQHHQTLTTSDELGDISFFVSAQPSLKVWMVGKLLYCCAATFPYECWTLFAKTLLPLSHSLSLSRSHHSRKSAGKIIYFPFKRAQLVSGCSCAVAIFVCDSSTIIGVWYNEEK